MDRVRRLLVRPTNHRCAMTRRIYRLSSTSDLTCMSTRRVLSSFRGRTGFWGLSAGRRKPSVMVIVVVLLLVVFVWGYVMPNRSGLHLSFSGKNSTVEFFSRFEIFGGREKTRRSSFFPVWGFWGSGKNSTVEFFSRFGVFGGRENTRRSSFYRFGYLEFGKNGRVF